MLQYKNIYNFIIIINILKNMLINQKNDDISVKSSRSQSITHQQNHLSNIQKIQQIHFNIAIQSEYHLPQINSDHIIKDKIRRSKKDHQDRNFNCGCGKKYLSYPALYTHIKTKHDGLTPEGTQHFNANLNQNKISKRGRPKREINEYNEKNETIKYNKLQLSVCDLTILEHLEDNFEGQFDIQKYNNNIINNKNQLYNILKKCYSDGLEPQSQQKVTYRQAAASFLIQLSKILNQTLTIQFYWFLESLLECINQNYKSFLMNDFENNVKMQQLKQELNLHIQDQSCQIIPIIGDYFLRIYLPQNYEGFNIHLSIFMFYDFCKWLTKMKLSKINLNINLALNESTK